MTTHARKKPGRMAAFERALAMRQFQWDRLPANKKMGTRRPGSAKKSGRAGTSPTSHTRWFDTSAWRQARESV